MLACRGQATRWLTPSPIGRPQPGQVYCLVAAFAGMVCTIHWPSLLALA